VLKRRRLRKRSTLVLIGTHLGDSTIKIWNLENKKLRKTIKDEDRCSVNCILELLPDLKKAKVLYISNMYGVMRAIGGGSGIGALPEYMKSSKNNLVPILPDIETPKATIYFTYPLSRKGSKKIDALRDFLVREVNKEKSSS
jgi:DNA-binding transcriptional LysR family regulator